MATIVLSGGAGGAMRKTLAALTAAAACALACAATAQSYPARPVKILVGFAAGGRPT